MDLFPCLSQYIMIISFLVILLLAALHCFFTKPTKSSPRTPQNLPPGTFGWPFIGETPDLFRSARSGTPERFIMERMKKYNSQIFRTKLFNEPTVVLCNAEGNRFLFANEGKKVTVWLPSSTEKMLGSCILTTGGEEGKRMKKMLLGFFCPDALARFTIAMDVVTKSFIKTHFQGKEEMEVFPMAKLYSFEVACHLFLSIRDPQHILKLAGLFVLFLDGIISIPLNVPGMKYYGANKAVGEIKKELGEVIRQRKVRSMEQKSGGRVASPPDHDLVSYLLQNVDDKGRFMTEDEIVNNLVVFLIGAHEPPSSAITSLMKFLGELPHVYNKVLTEQKEIAKRKRPGEGLKLEDIRLMKYSWSVVSEVIRLVPPIIGGLRVALEDINYGGYTIPKGWKLMWSPTVTNNDSMVFPRVKEFDENRFYGTSTPSTYIPFGGGPRMCLGKNYAQTEILVFLHNVITSFSWDLLAPDEKIEFNPLPVPSRRLPIRLRPHHS